MEGGREGGIEGGREGRQEGVMGGRRDRKREYHHEGPRTQQGKRSWGMKCAQSSEQALWARRPYVLLFLKSPDEDD